MSISKLIGGFAIGGNTAVALHASSVAPSIASP